MLIVLGLIALIIGIVAVAICCCGPAREEWQQPMWVIVWIWQFWLMVGVLLVGGLIFVYRDKVEEKKAKEKMRRYLIDWEGR